MTPAPPNFSLSYSGESESSSIAYAVEQDASVWTRLKDLRRLEIEYDSANSIDVESRMHLDLSLFQKSECFGAAFRAYIVFGSHAFEGNSSRPHARITIRLSVL